MAIRKSYHSRSSHAITGIEYDDLSEKMTVDMAKGGSFEYFNVPPRVARQFQNSSSQGRFYNENIRGNYYPSGPAGWKSL